MTGQFLNGKNVAVIGGDPGNLLLARLLQMRGAHVQVYEQGDVSPNLKVYDKDARLIVNILPGEAGASHLCNAWSQVLGSGTVMSDLRFLSSGYKFGHYELTFEGHEHRNADMVVGTDGIYPYLQYYGNTQVTGNSGFALIQGEIPNADHLGIVDLLDQGIILVLGDGRLVSLKQKSDGSLLVYCAIYYSHNNAGLTIGANSDDAIRQLLKTFYAGWHHVYHEVFAMATNFASWFVQDTFSESRTEPLLEMAI